MFFIYSSDDSNFLADFFSIKINDENNKNTNDPLVILF